MQLNVTENIPAVDVFACISRVLSAMRSLPHKYSMYISVHGNIEICLTLHIILQTFNKGEMSCTDIVSIYCAHSHVFYV